MEGSTKHSLSAERNLLQRNRIKKLMEKGLQNALVTVVAPPGYGKTHEMANFFGNAGVRLSWMRATKLDNLPGHFWDNHIASLARECTQAVKPLRALGFPNTLANMDAWLRIVASDIYKDSRLSVHVVDNFDEIKNDEVRMLFDFLAETGVENFCLVLISRQKTDIDLKALRSGGGVFRVTGEQLKFTEDEIGSFFKQCGLYLPNSQFSKIYRETEGWPLLVYLLSRQLQKNKCSYEESMGKSMEMVHSMFESEFFSKYDASTKEALIKLSFLSSFSANLISKIVDDADVSGFMETLAANQFVTYDSNLKGYVFQSMYCDFLQERHTPGLSGELRHVYSMAADCALEKGCQLHAVEYYSRSHRYNEMLSVMVDYIGGRMAVDKMQADYFFRKLEELPPRIKNVNYLAGYIESCLYIQMMQPEKAFGILEGMERELLGKPGKKERAMLGEVYERIAGIRMMQRKECFMGYFKKAYELIPKGSAYKKKSMLRYKNYSIFSVQDYTPGAVERMEKEIYDGFEYMNAVEGGVSAGFQYLFSAEAAYQKYELKRAQGMASKAFFEAKTAGAHDIACNALLILATVALKQGKYLEMTDIVHSIEKYVDSTGIPELIAVKEYVFNWRELSLCPAAQMPKWVNALDSGFVSMTPLVIGRGELHYAIYLLVKKQYSTMVAYLEQVKPLYTTKGWGESLSANIMSAIGYMKLRDEERAVDVFKETYDLTYHNKIMTPFIEFAGLTRTLIEHVRKLDKYEFDWEWLDDIYRKASTFGKRLSFMMKEHARQNNIAPEREIQLTEREVEVLRCLAQGLTREEIAEEHHIAISTVKSVITNIYNKLGAVNRVDAVRTALDFGILDA
ncbi:LuxR C-terminal-related transcriptional regulator [Christensenellaceae bacterium OttesenSCG-928-K19]|nr:LuxR C-terminal-related transcriptional regulator [Christensenellaceae bacterium OttesenSCG-928-K19]